MEYIGWVGSIFLAICGLPQAYASWKQGHSNGISSGFLALWGFGEVLTLLYVIHKMDAPLLLNYFTNILSLSVIIFYKLNPKSELAVEKLNEFN